jgi:hypothetical protein
MATPAESGERLKLAVSALIKGAPTTAAPATTKLQYAGGHQIGSMPLTWIRRRQRVGDCWAGHHATPSPSRAGAFDVSTRMPCPLDSSANGIKRQ